MVINPRETALELYNGPFVTDQPWLSILPPQTTLRSLSHDVVINGQISVSANLSIAPSDHGQFDLFAANDFLLDSSIYESDASALSIPTALNPSGTAVDNFRILFSERRADDDTPALITAGHDIVVAGTGSNKITLATASRVTAGRDMVNLALRGHNVRPTDVTSISAGRDIRYTSDNRESLIGLGGPGRLDILAGARRELRVLRRSFHHRLDRESEPVEDGCGSHSARRPRQWHGLHRLRRHHRFEDG